MTHTPDYDAATVERATDALMASRLTWGTHADRWGDVEWQREFWSEAASIVLATCVTPPATCPPGECGPWLSTPGTRCGHYDSTPHWHHTHGGWDPIDSHPDARPLVVIDPEDREQVERLHALYEDLSRGVSADDMQSALREFANPAPPKLDEPIGDGAVVEDAMGHRWVRIAGTAVDSPPWRHRGHAARSWDKVTAVRVLSEGVSND